MIVVKRILIIALEKLFLLEEKQFCAYMYLLSVLTLESGLYLCIKELGQK
jgi:hypothetical protein